MTIKTAGQALLGKQVSFKTHISEGVGKVESITNSRRGEYVLVRVMGREGKRNAVLSCRPSQCKVQSGVAVKNKESGKCKRVNW